MSDMFAPWAASIAQIPILNAIPGWAVVVIIIPLGVLAFGAGVYRFTRGDNENG